VLVVGNGAREHTLVNLLTIKLGSKIGEPPGIRGALLTCLGIVSQTEVKTFCS